ncbi:MAG: hybrid sensor histidine kinase/response regulator [Candidatus Dadabacteria bacterium]|nr:MAG: hybrid sensor histidine kinase/response regulator [Candidatus Dadabacteria bacterium]
MSEEQDLTNIEPILVVDDSATNRFLLRSILEALGYPVIECEDGIECLEYCEADKPSVVLLDIMMPRMDGIEVCRRLREKYGREELPIIMVTTKSESSDLATSMELGANDYVTKPLDRQVFLARLENQLLLRSSQQKIREQQEVLENALEIQSAMGDVLPEGIAVFDVFGACIYRNAHLVELCSDRQIDSAQDVFKLIFNGALEGQLHEILSQIHLDKRLVIDRELTSENLSVQVVTKPIWPDRANSLRLWIWRDLTKMRELERQTRQQIKLDTVGIFAAGVAHNFNNIMGGILGASEVLKHMARGNTKLERCIKVIQTAVDNGVKLTKKMSVLKHRDVSGADEEGLNLLDALLVVVGTQQELVGERITFEVNVPEECRLLKIDTTNFIDIMSNLISNAVDAIEESGTIRIVARELNSDFVELTLQDNGHGMDQETLSKIYEPFFSTKNLDVRNSVSMEGNGLGLWNVYNLVKMAGGEIEHRSKPGEGTTVILQLPVKTVCEYHPKEQSELEQGSAEDKAEVRVE